MAKPVERDIPRGRGTVDPTFTQQVGIQPVSPGQRPVKDQLTQLREVLLSAGSALARSLNVAGTRKARLDAKKTAVVRQQNAELAEVDRLKEVATRTEMDRRLTGQKTILRNLLLDSRAANPEWLLQQAEIRFNNTALVEEQDIWAPLVLEARQELQRKDRDIDRERRRDLVEDINLAGMTASQVVSEAFIELQQDADLQDELIGDGTSIPGRVQNWVLSLAHEASPEIFDVREGDQGFNTKIKERDNLMAQLIQQSNRVSDGLIKQYLGQVNDENEVTAEAKLDALFTGALKGTDAGVKESSAAIQEIEDNFLSHLPDKRRLQIINRTIDKSLRAAADGALDRNVLIRLNAARTILDSSPLSEVDRGNKLATFQERLSRDVEREFGDRVKEAIRSASSPRVDTDPESPFFGQVRSDISDPDAAISLAVEDPETNETGYDRVAREFLTEIGLDPDDASGMGVAVRDAASDMNVRGLEALQKQLEDEEGTILYLANQPGGSPQRAWETSPAFMAEQPGGFDEQALARLDRFLPEAQRDSLYFLLNSPVEQVEETRDLRAAIYGSRAKEVNEATGYNISDAEMTKLGNDWTQGNLESMWNTMGFYRSLNNKQQFLNNFGAKHGLNASVGLMIAHNQMFKARVTGRIPDWESSTRMAQNIMTSTDILARDKRGDPAVDLLGRIVMDENGREVPLTRKGEALIDIFNGFAVSRELADPLSLKPDESIDVQFAVPAPDPGIIGQFLRFSTNLLIPGTLGPRFVSEPSPLQLQAFLQSALQNIGEISTDNMVDVYFGLRANGLSGEDAGVGVSGFAANAGLAFADIGSGTQIRFDPLGAFGPNAMDFSMLSRDVEAYLDQGLPTDNFRELNAAFLPSNDQFRDDTFFAASFRDLPHLIMPHRFTDPGRSDAPPLEWRFATEEGAWGPAAQAGGLPLLFLTQDDTPEWVLLVDPGNNTPVFGFNYWEIQREE